MNIWALSDTHFNHKAICGPKLSEWTSGYRNFDSLEEMEEIFVQNINDRIKPGDRVIFGGDLLMGPDKLENFKRIWSRLNLNKCVNTFIRGNHDDEWMLKKNNLEEVEKLIGVKTCVRWTGTLGGKFCVFDHYGMRVWPHIGKGSFHFYAHSHNTLPPMGRSCDIGFDTFHEGHKIYTPYNLMDELIPFLEKRKIEGEDRHAYSES